MKKLLLLCLMFCLTQAIQAQQDPSRDALSLVLVKPHGGIYLPGGHLSQRFGPGAMVGLDVAYKTKGNWQFGLSGSHVFGAPVRENNIMRNITTSSGDIITESGVFEDYRLRQFGWAVYGKVGKIIPVVGPNPNSGLLVELGYGILQHKIWIETPRNNSPQISTEYKKGYDRLSNGMSFNPFIGYQHLSDNKLINFFIGVDFHYAITQNRRTVNFDTGLPDTQQRTDLMLGLKAGWILPLYQRAEKAMLFY
jgi:hypothetical protein